ncbi:heme peroxidase-domain-containing protein [Podospora didyma]|uniref:Heme peroxidase-domain-containing protein n=1 Tax=Podospora didyma TaxID=330526 RepID=A0AAE0U3S6_9PEZI|nr:heme peroxidase-domain-containing protein [Podospora didyma]
MSSDTQRPILGGRHAHGLEHSTSNAEMARLNKELGEPDSGVAGFHGDALIGNKKIPKLGWAEDWLSTFLVACQHIPQVATIINGLVAGKGVDKLASAPIFGSLSNNSELRASFIESQVKQKYERMLHPPLTYLGGAFKYRTADGKFNSALHPHLGQAGSPYAKTVPSRTAALGALPDPGDLFDRLMARDKPRESKSGLSSMLIYHATIIIHDIFRTNDKDKNISDSSSYLDLSPLYGFTEEMQRKVRDETFKLGLLKPDTFAEDRLLRQPPGVCIMLVMYNRYHNYAATQLRRINENGRFSVPAKFTQAKVLAAANFFVKDKDSAKYKQALSAFEKANDLFEKTKRKSSPAYEAACDALEAFIYRGDGAQAPSREAVAAFYKEYDAAWDKLDDDLFNTARLITCGMYIQISIHDYLRALMGFHQYDTTFTLDPRVHESAAKTTSRGLGNQVTVEFNALYRFHCAISLKDEKYTEDLMKEMFGKPESWDPKTTTLPQFVGMMGQMKQEQARKGPVEPSEVTFGLKKDESRHFTRNEVTGLFDDQKMVNALLKAMDDPISNFGPKNVPKSLKAVEIMGILQARKWEVGTLNDFREFFGLKRHDTFESISKNTDIANSLRDLYEHPDKVEFYPGVFCESNADMGADPGPSDVDSALWAAIFSDAIGLVRSDRFYTVDWNTNSLTSWGMKEVTPDNDVLKTSVFHRLLQRSFPEWFPADSIHFFHPFYTAETNANFAKEQGYDKVLAPMKMTKPAARNWLGRKKMPTDLDEYDTSKSTPKKPSKPIYLKTFPEIRALLQDTSDVILHPARGYLTDLPKQIQDVLIPRPVTRALAPTKIEGVPENHPALIAYFIDTMRAIIKRETITMNPKPDFPKPDLVYQIDITRDFAIPAVTRFVADFLGVGHLLKDETNPKAPYTENEFYQHITNCQTYLSYNSDETKTLKRRKAFKESISFLYDVTRKGNMAEANKFAATRALQSFGRWLLVRSGRKNAMVELGFKIAQQILEDENGDSGKAAAILLLVGLDNAYNTVLAFASVLDKFLTQLYKRASGEDKTVEECDWLRIQRLVFENPDSKKRENEIALEIKNLVLDAQRKSVKLPIVRKASDKHDVVDKSDPTKVLFTVEKDQIIICDFNPTTDKPSLNGFSKTAASDEWDNEFLSHRSSFSSKFARYHPLHLPSLSLTTMITVLATLRNLRRGHDTQGRLKRVHIDSSPETYANYMAPQRIKSIEHEVSEKIAKAGTEKEKAYWRSVYSSDVLKPATTTYLTPEWDEMVPFPTTWKLRFDGYGKSDYGAELTLLKPPVVPGPVADYMTGSPPWYELPGGESRTGGTFATAECVCAKAGLGVCDCVDEAKVAERKKKATEELEKREKDSAKAVMVETLTNGCGM